MVKQIIKKMNKKVIIYSLIFIIVCLFLLTKKDYEIKYNIDNTEISEKYSKKEKTYTFILKNDNREYAIKLKNKQLWKKKLIKKITINFNDNTNCITPSGKLDFYPLCYQNDELISYQIIEDRNLLSSSFYQNISLINDEYNQIKINYLNNKKFFIWNYKGFDIIENESYKTVNLFSNDIYNIPLSYKLKNGLVIADYNSKYNFSKFYFLKAKNNKVKEIKTDKDLSFESYIAGDNKNSIYLIDKKNQKEYEINTKKFKIKDLTKNSKGKIFEDNEWHNVSMTKLINKEYYFSKKQIFNYQINDDKLYLVIDDYKQLVSNNKVKDIIEIEDDTVYYLVEDKLYMFSPKTGEINLMTCFEWNFNYKNMIYIF